MKLGINAFGCDHGRSGTGSYLTSLLHNLPDRTGHTIQLFGPELDKYTYSSGIESVGYAGVSLREGLFSKKIWHKTAFLNFVKKHGYNRLLFPAGIDFLPGVFPVPSVLVIQSVLSNNKNFFVKEITKNFLRFSLNSASGFIVPSSYIKQDILSLGIPESKITVIYHGVDRGLFFPRDIKDDEHVLIQPFSIRRPYIIYASRMTHAEKYHAQLIHAFNIFKQKSGLPYRLVLAGAQGKSSESVHAEVLKSPFSSDILLTGYFPHENLAELYSAADLCVFPSAIEGVGLPILEAMACGIPTACARAGALPEMIGQFTHYFDPNSPEEIAQAISVLIKRKDGKNDARRSRLIEGGLEWVKKYDWQQTARKTLEYLATI